MSPDGVDTQLYLFKVTLLGQTLTPPKLCTSIDEARQVAAEFALQQLLQLISSSAVEHTHGGSSHSHTRTHTYCAVLAPFSSGASITFTYHFLQ